MHDWKIGDLLMIINSKDGLRNGMLVHLLEIINTKALCRDCEEIHNNVVIVTKIVDPRPRLLGYCPKCFVKIDPLPPEEIEAERILELET